MTTDNLIINNLEFAKKEQSFKGDLSLSRLPRVCEWLQGLGALSEAQLSSLAGDEGAQNKVGVVSYQLSGRQDGAGQQFLTLALSVEAELICQRCFELMKVEESEVFEYLLTKMDEAEILNEVVDMGDEYDLLTVEREMNVQALIEDEVIAAIPYAPMHAELCQETKSESGEKPNPFAVLKNLK